MKTESMVTRAARAMFASQQWPEQFHPSFEVEQERFETAARAAIEAMREPTDSMSVSGGLKCEQLMFEGVGTGVIFQDMATVFTSMIDRALSEEGE